MGVVTHNKVTTQNLITTEATTELWKPKNRVRNYLERSAYLVQGGIHVERGKRAASDQGRCDFQRRVSSRATDRALGARQQGSRTPDRRTRKADRNRTPGVSAIALRRGDHLAHLEGSLRGNRQYRRSLSYAGGERIRVRSGHRGVSRRRVHL